MGQEALTRYPLKSSQVITALPLVTLVPFLEQSMVVVAQVVDMLNPSSPTDTHVNSTLKRKCTVFLTEGIVTVLWWHYSSI